MNSILGTSLGISSPAVMLLWPAVLGLLVYAYLRKGREKKIIVSSIMFLRELARPARSRRRFVPPLRFFFELLLLTLLVGGLAGAFWDNAGERVAVIIDNSLSMSAIDPGDTQRENRLQRGITECRTVLRALGGSSKVDLFSSAPTLQRRGEEAISPGDAEQQLREIGAQFSSDDLDRSVQRLADSNAYARIVVVTDRGDGRPAGGPRSPVEIRSVSKGGPSPELQNVAISELHAELEDGARTVRVRISAHTTAAVKVSVRGKFYAISEGDPAEIGEDSTELSISAGQSLEASLTAPRSDSAAVHVSLAALGADAFRVDTMREDNQGFLSFESAQGEVLLVSDITPDALGLNRLPALKFIHRAPADFDRRDIPGGVSVVVFHGLIPEQLPDRSAVMIAPQHAGAGFTPGEMIAEAPVTTFQTAHPINSYVNLGALLLKRVTPLRGPAWAPAIVQSTAGAALLAGEFKGRRYLVTGFELLPFEGKRSPVLSILFLNMLKWLADTALHAGYQQSFSFVPLAEPSAEVRRVGEASPISPTEAAGKVPRVALERPGLYALQSGGRTEKLIAVNFFSEPESNLLSLGVITPPAAAPGGALEDQRRLLLYSVIAALVLGALLVEWLVLLAKWTRSRRGRQGAAT